MRSRPNERQYKEYIQSDAWRTSDARRTELLLSGFRCRICNSAARLEVHHRTYARFRRERAGDLTTLCSHCHLIVTDMLRRRRYRKSTPLSADVNRALPGASQLTDPTR